VVDRRVAVIGHTYKKVVVWLSVEYTTSPSLYQFVLGYSAMLNQSTRLTLRRGLHKQVQAECGME
jgi:hypothetical protein